MRIQYTAAGSDTWRRALALEAMVFGFDDADGIATLAEQRGARGVRSFVLLDDAASPPRIVGGAAVLPVSPCRAGAPLRAPVWHLDAVFVAPGARRRGHAGALMRVVARLCDMARAWCTLRLSRAWFAAPADERIGSLDVIVRFYQRHGFVASASGPGDTHVVMVRRPSLLARAVGART